MQKRYKIFLTKQEEDTRLLGKLQEEMSGLGKQQDTILNVICQEEKTQLNQSRDIREIRMIFGEMQISRVTGDTDTNSKKDMSDWNDVSYDEEL